jgi:hypothetical protein
MSAGHPDDWRVDWVRAMDIPVIAQRIRAIREGAGGAPDPDGAMQLLGAFARYRETLLGLRPEAGRAEGFAPLDAAAVLSLAALTRPVAEAAVLAIEQWAVESRQRETPPRLTDSIVHDVTAQRIVPEVAVFIAECRRRGQAALAAKALNAFVVASSGRTNFDKALLFISLRATDCAEEADHLLSLALRQAGADASALPVTGSAGLVGIVAALHHLSPAETIVEDWLDEQVNARGQERDTIALAASLLIGERSDDRQLARHVAVAWKPHQLIGVARNLAGRAPARANRRPVLGPPAAADDPVAGRAQECLLLIRRYAAARSDTDLAEIIRLWHKSGELAGTLPGLLTDIVAGGPGRPGPRSIEFVGSLQETLKDRGEVPGRWCRELNAAAAVQVSGRTHGSEVAAFLGRVDRRELPRTAQAVNRQLTAPLLHADSDIEREAAIEKFVDYVRGLQALPRPSTPTFWALRALSDPAAGGQAPAGRVIADIAARVYAHQDVPNDAGFDLLERCLENEQWLSADDAADIVARVRSSPMHDDDRWHPLLSATVGRWADTRRREQVVKVLRRRSFDTDADAIIRSFQ